MEKLNLKFIAGIIVILCILGFGVNATAQDNSFAGYTKKDLKYYNWHNLDFKKNKTAGISTDKAYKELLKNKKANTVIVAVIDGGVDINHADLKDKIWINTCEIAGNGIDDDHNGYIDDIHGWNFLGNSVGQNINKETLEITRLYRYYLEKFKGIDSVKLFTENRKEYSEFLSIQTKFLEKYNEAKEEYTNCLLLLKSYNFADSIVKTYLGKSSYDIKDLKSVKLQPDENLSSSADFLMKMLEHDITYSDLYDNYEYYETQVNYNYNTNYNARSVIGDDPLVNTDTRYGNNNVIGPDPDHGTFVSGIITADRNNNMGLNGIADSVKIMVLRAVPNGDEYDKDIANAIIYAVNNGAKIINCSFGKTYSPQKHFVDEALKFAREKDVLIIHAAGNEAENNDSINHYPLNIADDGTVIDENWITVGASTQKANSDFVASFSNYGQKTVDLFAPGYRIYSSLPNNKYGVQDGTSFSAPMVVGAAALIKSYYPHLSAKQIKDIILQSGRKYPKLSVYPPNEMGMKITNAKIKFSTLSLTGSTLNVYNALKLAEKIQSLN
jgi:subtilisin family serine protease